jgi:hypothetical protein
MAAKKSSDKKVAVKKAVAKKVGVKKKIGKNNLIIKVPQGGQVIRSFNLLPSLPVNGKAANWLLTDPNEKKPKDITSIRVSFSVKSSDIEQEFERAILIVNMQQNTHENGYWRFALNGIATAPQHGDVDNDIEIEIVNQGATLIAHVQVIGDTQEIILFGYVASFTDTVSGQVTIYESQDPDIIPGRP